MVGLLVVSVLVLVPQPRAALGYESLVVGIVVLALLLSRLRLRVGLNGPAYRRVVPTVILGAFAIPIVVGGASLVADAGGGLYWFVPAVVLGFCRRCPECVGAVG